jgi:hypothetical protein
MDKIFLNNNDIFVYLFIIWSFLSLMRGHISYVAMEKDTFLPIMGYVVLLVYFFVSVSGRVHFFLLRVWDSLTQIITGNWGSWVSGEKQRSCQVVEL